jgi:hypothetical protein
MSIGHVSHHPSPKVSPIQAGIESHPHINWTLETCHADFQPVYYPLEMHRHAQDIVEDGENSSLSRI